MKKIYIVGNWKMNKTFSEADDFIAELAEFVNEKELENVEVMIFLQLVLIFQQTLS